MQIFPMKKRVVDSANQTWIWCLPPDMELPLGFPEGDIGFPEEAAAMGAKQRAFEPGILDEVNS